MPSFFRRFRDFFLPLNGAQKTLFGVFSVGILLLIGLLFYWALKPNYVLLYGSLAPESAQQIVEELQGLGVSYELRDGGRAVAVPRNQVYTLRLKFATLGVSGGDYKGYELFDQNALGMTDFMQRLNWKRALEGELARTISSLEQVEQTRVHIVMPERSAFQENQEKASASVIVNLNRGKGLSKEQIQGISSLIAGSVEGLTDQNVVILDQVGTRLSENINLSEDTAASTAQIKIRQEMENYLTQKGQSMLDRVLGAGNSILRVSTEHNFDKVFLSAQKVDPESRIVISEEKRSSRNSGQTQESAPTAQESEPFRSNVLEDETLTQIRNYEVNRINEQQEKGSGEITRISASILLNYKRVKEANADENKNELKPYSQEEINEIQKIMSSALGLTSTRGDEITVTQILFQDPFPDVAEPASWLSGDWPVADMVQFFLLTVVVIAISIMVYKVSKNFNVQYDPLLDGPSDAKPSELNGSRGNNMIGNTTSGLGHDGQEEDLYVKKLSDGARKKLQTIGNQTKEIEQLIDQNPAEAASVLRTIIKQKKLATS